MKFRKSFTGLAPDAIEALENFNWTGNVRELRNMIERSVLLGNGTLLQRNHLGIESMQAVKHEAAATEIHPLLPALTPRGIDLPSILESIEQGYMEKALDLASGNATKASKLLKMSRDKFRYRVQKK